MRMIRHKICLMMGIGLMCVPGVWAQSQSQDQGQSDSQAQSQGQSQAPIPAVRPPITTVGGSEEGEPERPLAGGQAFPLGLSEDHSYWQPIANIVSTATSNGLGGNQGWTSFSTLIGGLDLRYLNGRSDLTLSYEGGGVVSNDGRVPNAVIQDLNLVERFYLRRSTLSFVDQTSYLPESAFGYAGLNLNVGTGLFLQPGLSPNGTVLTTQVRQIDNTSLAAIDTKLNPRSSITVMGGYSLLHFFGSNLIDSNATIVQASYNRAITTRNSVSVIYRFKAFRFSNNAQSINDSLAHLSFSRHVTGRMTFQVQAGPEYATFATPVLTGSGAPGATGSSRLSWSLGSTLSYQLERMQLGLSYNHGIAGGGGVFAGSVGDTVRGSVSRNITQRVNGIFSVGYGRNRDLAPAGSTNPGETFDNYYGVLGVQRRFGRTVRARLSYEAQYQTSNFSFCAGPSCGDTVLIHRVFLSLNWQGRPRGF